MQVTLPLITALYAGLNGLLALFLAIRVSMARAKKKIDLGDGGDQQLLQKIRVHGNNAEYLALILVLLALIEALGAPVLALHVLGIALTLGRVLHAQGLASKTGPSFGRIVGQTATWLVLACTSLYALYLFSVGGRAVAC